EDGIRDFHVTGVQTCALPIWMAQVRRRGTPQGALRTLWGTAQAAIHGDRGSTRRRQLIQRPTDRVGDRPGAVAAAELAGHQSARSEERRVGEECALRSIVFHT